MLDLKGFDGSGPTVMRRVVTGERLAQRRASSSSGSVETARLRGDVERECRTATVHDVVERAHGATVLRVHERIRDAIGAVRAQLTQEAAAPYDDHAGRTERAHGRDAGSVCAGRA